MAASLARAARGAMAPVSRATCVRSISTQTFVIRSSDLGLSLDTHLGGSGYSQRDATQSVASRIGSVPRHVSDSDEVRALSVQPRRRLALCYAQLNA